MTKTDLIAQVAANTEMSKKKRRAGCQRRFRRTEQGNG